MSAKPKKSSKAPKPNCKVWIQVGEEELTEYLTKPIDGLDGLDGVDAFESYVVVALGDVLTVHCQAKPGIVDEFALATDGIFRACETRRHAVLIFDKALHRSKGKGKQQAAVYRSDMVVQMRNEKETRLANGTQEPSQVGKVVIEGWRKVDGDDPIEKGEETLKFVTYEDGRAWYDINRFVDPAPGHLPPFEISFVHGKNSSPARSGPRTKVDAAATRKKSEWKLAYKFVFNLRSATELHKLGQTDVPVRNPTSSLFAEEPAEEASDSEDHAAEDESEEESDSFVEVKPKSKEESVGKPEEKAMDKPKNAEQPTSIENALQSTKSKTEKTTAVPHQIVLGSLDLMVKSAPHSTEKQTLTVPAIETAIDFDRSTGEPDLRVEEPSNKKSEIESSHPTLVTPKKRSLPGLKSAPASRDSRYRANRHELVSVDFDDDDVLPATEVLEHSGSQQAKEPAEARESTYFPVTPPPSAQKFNHGFESIGNEQLERQRASISHPSSLQLSQDLPPKLSEPKTYITSSKDFTTNHAQHGRSARPSVDEGSGYTSMDNVAQQAPSSRVSFANDRSILRASSPASDATTEIADPADILASVKNSQRQSSSTSIKESQVGLNLHGLSGTSLDLNRFSQSFSTTPDIQNHTEPSPVLGSPSKSFRLHTESGKLAGNPVTQVSQDLQEQEVASLESPSQFRQEMPDSFADAPMTLQHEVEVLRPEPIHSQFKVPNSANTRYSFTVSPNIHSQSSSSLSQPDNHKSPYLSQLNRTIGKRKADENTGNGSFEESRRPQKSSVAPTNRSIVDTLRHQQEENERLQKELEEIREHNATLESIRELKNRTKGVRQRIETEKARQAVLEAELKQ